MYKKIIDTEGNIFAPVKTKELITQEINISKIKPFINLKNPILSCSINGKKYYYLNTRKNRETLKQLILKTAEVEHAKKLKNDFLSNISHELKTPMQGILGFTKLSIERNDELTSKKRLSYLNEIKASAQRLLQLINNLLELSSLENSKKEYRKTAISYEDIVNLVKEAQNSLFSKIEAKGLHFTINSSPSTKKITGNIESISAVINNLLANAIQFSPVNEEITINIEDASGKELKFTIIDRGIGIPENETEIIFGKFVQSSKTDTGAGGTGLGLAISKKIILDHAGSIRALKKKGGATFIFTIPWSE